LNATSPKPSRGKTILLLSSATAAPVALGFETMLRQLIVPPALEAMRRRFEPELTTVAWVDTVLAVVVTLAGFKLATFITAHQRRRIPPGAPPEADERAVVGAFFLTSSVVQIPALFATILHLLGASLAPVLAAIAVSTVGILIQALRVK
jgi:hypothetical protein